MHYHLILTELCNSNCKYCYEKSMREAELGIKSNFEFEMNPAVSEVDINKLKEFLERDKNPVLIFYGGEPLLEIEKIKKIIDNGNIKNLKFRMQTNGKLLDKIPTEYLNKIDKILISIDGNKKRTDFNRGDGTYDKLVENINLIRRNGYKGEIVARMTIGFSDIYEQVLHLIDLTKERLFDSIHWQLDAGFYSHDFNEKEFSRFVEEYNSGVKNLVDFWIEEMYCGNVLKLYPFMGIMESILNNEKTLLRCGGGHSGFAITTNGMISACPIMNSIKDFYVGDINCNVDKLKKIEISECNSCNYLNLCGGRCLYWRKAKLWPEKGDEMICNTIKFLINLLKEKENEIKQLIDKKIIKKSDFFYEKYFGPEIIP
ncbi:MAG: TIGR04084 family radical SAM/SPASM domain-containing protein [Candidatus Pacearchaeota archaeon]